MTTTTEEQAMLLEQQEHQKRRDREDAQQPEDAIDFEVLKECCNYSPEKPRRIGGLRDLKKFLENMGIKTRGDLQSEIDNCLVIIKRGNVYYDDTRC